jgi:hypothetical protein
MTPDPEMLDTNCRFPDPDLAYRILIEAHRGLTDEESAQLNTRLILILTNQIGEIDLLRAAVALARAEPTNGEAGAPLPRREASDTVTSKARPRDGR